MRSLRANEPTLSWPDAPADGEVDDGDVLGLAGARRDDAGIAQLARRLPAVQRLGQRAALVGLEQHGVGRAGGGGLAQQRRSDTRKSSPTTCSLRPTGAREAREALRVVLGQRVLDRDDGVALDPAQQQLDQAVAVELAPLQAQRVAAAAAELARPRCPARSPPARRARSRPRSIAATSVSSASSLVSKAGHQPPSSATPCSSAARAHQQRRRAR